MRSWPDMRDHALHLTTAPAASARGERALEFDPFFERERARLYQALCLVTRNRFEAEELAHSGDPPYPRPRG